MIYWLYINIIKKCATEKRPQNITFTLLHTHRMFTKLWSISGGRKKPRKQRDIYVVRIIAQQTTNTFKWELTKLHDRHRFTLIWLSLMQFIKIYGRNIDRCFWWVLYVAREYSSLIPWQCTSSPSDFCV